MNNNLSLNDLNLKLQKYNIKLENIINFNIQDNMLCFKFINNANLNKIINLLTIINSLKMENQHLANELIELDAVATLFDFSHKKELENHLINEIEKQHNRLKQMFVETIV